MSVLIKGFEKPDHCLRCPVKGIDDECLLQSEAANADYESWEDQMANCPIVPIPEHGRLIDADELAATCDEPHWCAWLSDIDNAPTIIQAEPPKDEAPTGPYDLLYEEGGYNSNGI